jgi:hypothetical protein
MELIKSNNATTTLEKACYQQKVKRQLITFPIVLDRVNGFAYMHSPSEKGTVDVVRYDYDAVLFNPVNLIPGFKSVTLAPQHRFSALMSTKENAGGFGKVRDDVAAALLTARDEIIANGYNVLQYS